MRSQRYEHAPVHKRLDVVFRSTVNSRFSNGGFPRCEKPIRIGNIFLFFPSEHRISATKYISAGSMTWHAAAGTG
jgi:hypothetical protein